MPSLVDGPEPAAVLVRWASLEPPASRAPVFHGYLSSDELARGERFVHARDRDRFLAGRSFLRMVLGASLGHEPAHLRFTYGPNGKPALAEPRCDLEFNLAHSDTLVACALARDCEALGIDVERVRPIDDAAGVARVAFPPGEVARLESLPVPERLRAFYEAWTRREAFLKALGCGFGGPVDDDPVEVERFSLHALELDAGHVGAVAVSGHGWRVTTRPWHWPARD